MTSQIEICEVAHRHPPLFNIFYKEFLSLLSSLAKERYSRATSHPWQVNQNQVETLCQRLHYTIKGSSRCTISMNEDKLGLLLVLRLTVSAIVIIHTFLWKAKLNSTQATIRRQFNIVSFIFILI